MNSIKLPLNLESRYNYPQVAYPKTTITLNGILLNSQIESVVFRACNNSDSSIKLWIYKDSKGTDVGMSMPPYSVEYFAISPDKTLETNGILEITWLL